MATYRAAQVESDGKYPENITEEVNDVTDWFRRINNIFYPTILHPILHPILHQPTTQSQTHPHQTNPHQTTDLAQPFPKVEKLKKIFY